MSLKNQRTLVIAGILAFFGAESVDVCLAETPANKYYDTLAAHIASGQYSLVKKDATEWAASENADLESMSQACALLSDNKLHDAAVCLLKRLDWNMPLQCKWPMDTIRFMSDKAMADEVDTILTRGTALVAANSSGTTRQTPDLGYRTGINPQAAAHLFGFNNDTSRFSSLCVRYDAEVAKRPHDTALLSEYAYWLVQHKSIDKAASVISMVSLDKLDLLTLVDLGKMWSQHNSDKKLVEYAILPLEKALEREINDDDAMRYTSGWQAIVGTDMAKRLLREHILNSLGDAYAFVGQLEKARTTYEAYLTLPRRGSWGDRTGVQRKYAKVLKELGMSDSFKAALQKKAKASSNSTDWAELAAYLQGREDIAAAKAAWEKAISLSPPDKRGFKVEQKRGHYVRQLLWMLEIKKMYGDEITVLKQVLSDGPEDYVRHDTLEKMAVAYLRWGKKADAIAFLMKQLEEGYSLDVIDLLLRTDHEKSLLDKYSVARSDLEKLPTWNIVLAKTKALPESEKAASLAEFYGRYNMYAEYVDLVEAWPKEKITWTEMLRLLDFSHRCKRFKDTVRWGKEILQHVGENDFPASGSREHINTLEDISEYAAMDGDYDTALEYAKMLCLIVPERFYFAEELAKVATALGKQDKLLAELKTLAAANPDRWVVWTVLAQAYGTFGKQDEKTACLKKAEALK
ncbi:MAG: hypothetical protein WA705_18525 [Candidatus Ozemobacteraceae bacterium]